jgi:hypothetical protein
MLSRSSPRIWWVRRYPARWKQRRRGAILRGLPSAHESPALKLNSRTREQILVPVSLRSASRRCPAWRSSSTRAWGIGACGPSRLPSTADAASAGACRRCGIASTGAGSGSAWCGESESSISHLPLGPSESRSVAAPQAVVAPPGRPARSYGCPRAVSCSSISHSSGVSPSSCSHGPS